MRRALREERRISARAEQPPYRSRSSRTPGAHLRAGGAASVVGASPRGRSSHVAEVPGARLRGRISARAEQPQPSSWTASTTWAHLRAGGAAVSKARTNVTRCGASPRGRSSPRLEPPRTDMLRRISARAEQPARAPLRGCNRAAHLRAGGAAFRDLGNVASATGASPRGRSSPIATPPARSCSGRISARAEQPWRRTACRTSARAHLRAGGAAGMGYVTPDLVYGASPRGRSSHHVTGLAPIGERRISARAEQPPPRPTGR